MATFIEEELDGGVTRVILEGSLDIEGANAIDLRMNLVAGSGKAVLVDLQRVSFIGSMGMRSIVIPARALKARGGRMVLFAPNAMVEKALRTGAIDAIIPIHHDLQNAMGALR